jgi:hypothetical protein
MSHRRLLELRNSCATLYHQTAQRFGQARVPSDLAIIKTGLGRGPQPQPDSLYAIGAVYKGLRPTITLPSTTFLQEARLEGEYQRQTDIKC